MLIDIEDDEKVFVAQLKGSKLYKVSNKRNQMHKLLCNSIEGFIVGCNKIDRTFEDFISF